MCPLKILENPKIYHNSYVNFANRGLLELCSPLTYQKDYCEEIWKIESLRQEKDIANFNLWVTLPKELFLCLDKTTFSLSYLTLVFKHVWQLNFVLIEHWSTFDTLLVLLLAFRILSFLICSYSVIKVFPFLLWWDWRKSQSYELQASKISCPCSKQLDF